MGQALALANMETRMANVEKNTAELNTKMEGKLEALTNEVRGLKEALVEGFKEKGNIIVAGGLSCNSVEIFNWRQKLWSPLQSLPEQRYAATSFVYNNHMTIAGGYCSGHRLVDEMVGMNIELSPDIPTEWINYPIKLPAKLAYHSSVLYKNQLIVTGGYSGDRVSDRIDEVQLALPYTGTVKTLARMPEPRQCHSTEIFDDNLLIIGGQRTASHGDNLSSVVLYDIKKNECRELEPLPYELIDMATVRWRDNIVVIGGLDQHGTRLDKVIMYNVTTQQHHLLPPMTRKRRGCTAVVVENSIVVLGGEGEEDAPKSVEAFNFDRYTWEELPQMSQARSWHTTVVV